MAISTGLKFATDSKAMSVPISLALCDFKSHTFTAISNRFCWETDFYTPQVLGGAALYDNSAPAVYKIQGPSGTGFLYTGTAGAELSNFFFFKGQHLPAPEVYKNQSPICDVGTHTFKSLAPWICVTPLKGSVCQKLCRKNGMQLRSRSTKVGHKKAGRSDFEISDSNLMQAKCRKCGMSLSPRKGREIPQSEDPWSDLPWDIQALT